MRSDRVDLAFLDLECPLHGFRHRDWEDDYAVRDCEHCQNAVRYGNIHGPVDLPDTPWMHALIDLRDSYREAKTEYEEPFSDVFQAYEDALNSAIRHVHDAVTEEENDEEPETES